jgi:mono/diheme cytochrome c family protein
VRGVIAGAIFALALLWGYVASVAVCTADATRVAAGERIYGDYCAHCHGPELRNTSGGATFDLRRLRSADHRRFVEAVLNGSRQMPPWRGVLDADQIDAIWAYIRATVDPGVNR